MVPSNQPRRWKRSPADRPMKPPESPVRRGRNQEARPGAAGLAPRHAPQTALPEPALHARELPASSGP